MDGRHAPDGPDGLVIAGRLELEFAARQGRTALSRRDYTWPYSVGRVFHREGGDPARVIVQSGSGGIITGDRLAQRLVARQDAHALVLGQGAISVHRALGGRGSGEYLRIEAAPGAWIENLAEPRVLFDEADFAQESTVSVLGDGVAVSVESVVLEPVDGGMAHYRSETVVECDGERRAVERMRVHTGQLPSGMRAFGLIVAAGLAGSAAGKGWQEWAGSFGDHSAYGAASELPFGAGVAVRVVAADGRHLRRAIDAALEVLRASSPAKVAEKESVASESADEAS
ncbi:urease accessory protein UreD [Herbiconiux moechotypicola]|uniref:Urease accessory protein UreD n=1 Tax=Herbiconiux moechotypicola TaxID=637393 RepID=A0ABN3D9S7_9MICO